MDLQCLTSPEIHTVIFQKIPQKIFPAFYFPGHTHISFELCGIPSAPGQSLSEHGVGRSWGTFSVDIPSLAQESINEPEGKGGTKQEAVGDTESLAMKKRAEQ